MNRTNRHAAGMAATAACCLFLAGCASQPAPAGEKPAATDAPAGGADEIHRYDLRGAVVSVDTAAKTLVVNHEAIPGFMSAMTMPYKVKDPHLLDGLAPGQQVTATVVFTGREFWLEDVASAPAHR